LAGCAVDVRRGHRVRVGREAEDREHFRRVLREDVGGDWVCARAGGARGVDQVGLAGLLGTVHDGFFPLHVLPVRVETVADEGGGEAGSGDGGVAGVDFGFVVARCLGVGGHVPCGEVPAEFFIQGGLVDFAVFDASDVAGGIRE